MNVRSPLRSLDANLAEGSEVRKLGGRPPKADKKVNFHILEREHEGATKENPSSAFRTKEVLEEYVSGPSSGTGDLDQGPVPIADGTPKKRKMRNDATAIDAPVFEMDRAQAGTPTRPELAATPPRPRETSAGRRAAASNNSGDGASVLHDAEGNASMSMDALLRRLEVVESRLAEEEASKAALMREQREQRNRGAPLLERSIFQERVRAASASALTTLLRNSPRPGEKGFSSNKAKMLSRSYSPAMEPLGEQGSPQPVVPLSELSFLRDKLEIWRASYGVPPPAREKAAASAATDDASS